MSGLVRRNRNDRHSPASLNNLLYWKWHLPLMNGSCTKAFVSQTWHKLLWSSPAGHLSCTWEWVSPCKHLPQFCFSIETQVLNLKDVYYINNQFPEWGKTYKYICSRLSLVPTIWWDWVWKCLNWLYTDFFIKIVDLNFVLVVVRSNFKAVTILDIQDIWASS